MSNPNALEIVGLNLVVEYCQAKMHAALPENWSPSAQDKLLLAHSAAFVAAAISGINDKESPALAFVKILGIAHIQYVANHGVLPAIDPASRAALFSALMSAAVASAQQKLAALQKA